MSSPHDPLAQGPEGCPGTSQILAFLDGELPALDRVRAEAHLAGCDECRELVSALASGGEPPADPALDRTVATAPPGEAAAAVAVGERVGGKYRITRLLGQGGMGEVFAAEHEVLRTPVALKFLRSGPALDRRASARFLREARVSAQLSSEHIARVLDYGLLPRGGAPYLVLEYLEGEDLGALLARRGRLPLGEALDLLFQAADGLAVAHHAGVVHRDLKPSNLFVIDQGGTSLVKLLDFGIAKADQVDTHAAVATTGESFLGSPLYASPEQLQSSRSVDTRTDLWSLGCVAYEMLSGEAPFQGTTLTGLITAILTGTPAPLRPAVDLPPAAEEAILRCLRKDPAERPATVAALLSALAPFASEEARVLARRVARRLATPPSRPPLGSAAPSSTEPGLPPSSALLPSASPPLVPSPTIGAVSSFTAPDPARAVNARGRPRRAWLSLALVGAACLSIGAVGAFAWSVSASRAASPGASSAAWSAALPGGEPAASAPALVAGPASALASASASASAQVAGGSTRPVPLSSGRGGRPAAESAGPRKTPPERVHEPTIAGDGTGDRK